MGVITGRSLPFAREIIDTYRSFGFKSLFLKKFNPLGYGENAQNSFGLSDEEFIAYYKEHLEYLAELFAQGIFIADEHIRIFAGKILTPDRVNFMELRSPCGAGIGQIAYNYDGSVYTCDEGRMVGHDLFRLGSVNDSLKELIQNETVATMTDASLLEGLPCDLCHYAPYCGVCPILTHATRETIYTDQRTDNRCLFFTFLFDWIFDNLEKRDTMAGKYLCAHFPGFVFEKISESILSLPH
jgi:radical SAM protein with 4Fe4S-binding SPASM domain